MATICHLDIKRDTVAYLVHKSHLKSHFISPAHVKNVFFASHILVPPFSKSCPLPFVPHLHLTLSCGLACLTPFICPSSCFPLFFFLFCFVCPCLLSGNCSKSHSFCPCSIRASTSHVQVSEATNTPGVTGNTYLEWKFGVNFMNIFRSNVV